MFCFVFVFEDSKWRENIRATEFGQRKNHITYFVCNAVHIFIAFLLGKKIRVLIYLLHNVSF